jgi:transposase
MYIKKTTRKYKDKTYTNYMLVQAVHTPKGPRQKVICSLGDLRPRSGREWLHLAHKIQDALEGQLNILNSPDDPEVQKIVQRVKAGREEETGTGHKDDKSAPNKQDQEIVSVLGDKVQTENHRLAGPLHVGVQFWKRLGMDGILTEAGLGGHAVNLSCAMVMNRLVSPKSEHAMPDWIRSTALGDILNEDFSFLNHYSLYRNLDRLHPRRGRIEAALSEREKNLFNLDQTVYFYDLTSTYFEGQAKANPKAKRGYSRDNRPDCPQVLVGLVINRDGFPVAHEIFEGNRQDRKTLGEMLELLDKRVGLKPGQTVVVDRGMAFDDNLEQIKSRRLNYIVAARQKERDRWMAEFEDQDDFEEVIRSCSPWNPLQKKSVVRVKMGQGEQETHVLCLSAGRKEKDRAIREKHQEKFLLDVKKLEKRIKNGRLKRPEKIGEAIGRLKERYPRVARYFSMEFIAEEKRFKVERDQEKIAKAERLDGSYLLKTNRHDLGAEEAWRIYRLLTRAEKAFRDMKSPLAERPIFHHLERRVETHIFLCILAYHLLVAIEKTLLDRKIHTSWDTVRDTLSTHQIATVVLPTSDGSVLRIRRDSVPEEDHKLLYDLLDIPHKIVSPKKTWSKWKGDIGTEKTPSP